MTDILDRLVAKINRPLYCEKEYRGIVASVIVSLGKDKLDEIESLCKYHGKYSILLPCIKEAKAPQKRRIFKVNQFVEYKRNESIPQLLKWFENPHSGKRVYARTELKRRFITQSHKDQVRIIKSLLVSASAADREWAALWADRDWTVSYAENLKRALDMKPTRSVAITVINHMPIDFLKENHAILRSQASMQLCIRLGQDDPSHDISTYELDTFEWLYATAMAGRKIDEYDIEVDQKVFTYIYEFIKNDGHNRCLYPISFFSIPLLSKVFWALGQHGMTETLFSIMDCINYVFPDEEYRGWTEQFNRTLAWINREWKIEEDKGAVDESTPRTKEVTVIEELIKTLEPPYYKELRAELGLTPISFGKDGEDKMDEDFLRDFSENNPFG
jgi:hypothetical protein